MAALEHCSEMLTAHISKLVKDHFGAFPKLAGILSQSVGKPARYNLGIQCVRVLQVLAGTRSTLSGLAKHALLFNLF